MATYSSILAWRIPWTEEHGRLQSMGPKEVVTTGAIRHACKNILILFLILEEKLSVFHCWLWYYLWACHIWPLLCWGTFPLYLLCWEVFFIIKKLMFNFVKHSFPHLLIWLSDLFNPSFCCCGISHLLTYWW